MARAAGVLALKNPRETAGNAREHVFTVQLPVSGDRGFASIRPIDTSDPPFRVNQPYQSRPRFEPVANFGECFAGTIVGRKDLHDKIRRQLGEADRNGIGEAFSSHKGDIGCPDRVRSAKQRETSLGCEELAGLLGHAGFAVDVVFTADVHENRASDYLSLARLAALLPANAADLGQYIFVRARSTGDGSSAKLDWLYRG